MDSKEALYRHFSFALSQLSLKYADNQGDLLVTIWHPRIVKTENRKPADNEDRMYPFMQFMQNCLI